MQKTIWAPVKLPLAPRFAEIQPRAETEFADQERCAFAPALGQSVARQKDMAAFEPTIGLTVKMIAKGLRIGHIAVSPFERRSGGVLVGICVCHGQSR